MEEQIKVVVVEEGKMACVAMIPNDLKMMQTIVEGYIEMPSYDTKVLKALGDNIWNPEFDFCCNEDGKFIYDKPNRWVYNNKDYIAGPFIVAKNDGEGNLISMSDQEADVIIDEMNSSFRLGYSASLEPADFNIKNYGISQYFNNQFQV